MNIRDFTRIFDRDVIFSNEITSHEISIIFPKELYDFTKIICEQSYESRGIMIAIKNQNFYHVQYIKNIGIGTATSTHVSQEKLDEVNNFLQKLDSNAVVIDWHTHTRETGETWFETFSGGDYKSLVNIVNKKPSRVHVLFTPTHILTWGISKPRFQILKQGNPRFYELFTYWQDLYNQDLVSRLETSNF